MAKDNVIKTPPRPNLLTFLADTFRTATRRFFPILLLFAVGDFISVGLPSVIFREANDAPDGIRLLIESGALMFDIALTGTLGIWASRLWVAQMEDQPDAFTAGARTAGRRLGSIVIACVLTGVLSVFLFLVVGNTALIVLALMLAVPLSAGPPILLHVIGLENRSFMTTLPRFRQLVAGNFLRAFVYLLMLGLMATLVSSMVLQLVGIGVIEVGLTGGSLTAAGLVITSLLLGLTDLFLSAGLLVAYLDARKLDDKDFSVDELIEEEATEGDSES